MRDTRQTETTSGGGRPVQSEDLENNSTHKRQRDKQTDRETEIQTKSLLFV